MLDFSSTDFTKFASFEKPAIKLDIKVYVKDITVCNFFSKYLRFVNFLYVF